MYETLVLHTGGHSAPGPEGLTNTGLSQLPETPAHTALGLALPPSAPPSPSFSSPASRLPGSPFPTPSSNKCGRRGSSYPGLGPWRRPIPGARGSGRGGSDGAGSGRARRALQSAPRELPPHVPSPRQDARPAPPPAPPRRSRNRPGARLAPWAADRCPMSRTRPRHALPSAGPVRPSRWGPEDPLPGSHAFVPAPARTRTMFSSACTLLVMGGSLSHLPTHSIFRLPTVGTCFPPM